MLSLRFNADLGQVRNALAEAAKCLCPLDDIQISTSAEIVLAEVFNNIVKHAYQQKQVGLIDLSMVIHDTYISFRIFDMGQPMPNKRLPIGAPHILEDDVQSLPEGGFGWNLIRTLTQDLDYQHLNNQNILQFTITRHPIEMPD